MNKPIILPVCRRVLTALSVLLLSACSALRPAGTPPPAFYSLDGGREAASIPTPAAAPTLIVSPPRAAAGFDSQRIIYMRQAHKLDYFSHNEWVDPPARMLGPLLVTALGHTGAFRAVVLAPGATAGDLRLDTEIIRLQHEFLSSPSRVHFTLRATLVEDKSRRVLAWREFDGYATATSDDPYGGVLAANLAVQTELDKLAAFCAEATRPPRTTGP